MKFIISDAGRMIQYERLFKADQPAVLLVSTAYPA